jgi:hypothetical protein
MQLAGARGDMLCSSIRAPGLSKSLRVPAANGRDATGSYMSQFELQTSQTGPLSGYTVAVKDLFDVSATPAAPTA